MIRSGGTRPGSVTNNGIQGYYRACVRGPFRLRLGFLRSDTSDGGLPSAHGLQRLTNFNGPFYPTPIISRPGHAGLALSSPTIFVSPEDTVWQDPDDPNYYPGLHRTSPSVPARVLSSPT